MHLIPKGKDMGERMKKIEKTSLFNYNAADAFKKTQVASHSIAPPKQARQTYIEKLVKSKSFVPGVGSYYKQPKPKPPQLK